MNQIIQRIFDQGVVVDNSDNRHTLSSAIDQQEGKLIFETIRNDQNVRRSLEIGFGYGISSLYICEALNDREATSHTLIDPYQSSQWHNIGIKHLKEAGYDFYHLIEEKSEYALPQMAQNSDDRFDFIFVDGWHTFDHTMVDCFYAGRLLRVGGYLAIDDVNWKSVRRVVDYISRYPCYEIHQTLTQKKQRSITGKALRTFLSIIPEKTRKKLFAPDLYHKIFDLQQTKMIILKKVAEDNRNYWWYSGSF